MRTLILLLIPIIFTPFVVWSQDLQRGFELLEQGQFQEAKSFFEPIATKDSMNKTANLCYARAVGLSGEPSKAISIFQHLLLTYPNDLELLLNLAESYLWKNDPAAAIPVYQQLLQNDPDLFGAQLGIANSYSMGKSYDLAYEHIGKALNLEKDNVQANLSAKYIRMALANQLASEEQQFEQALGLLLKNLERTPNDQETLQLMANVYIISKSFVEADSVYGEMTHKITSLIGQSTTSHLMGKDELALEKASIALALGQEPKHQDFKTKTQINYVRALLWNNQLTEAGSILLEIRAKNDDYELIGLAAEVAMYEGDFILALECFNDFLSHEPESFSGLLGQANAFASLGMDRKAYQSAQEASSLYEGQQDIQNFLTKRDAAHSLSTFGSYRIGLSSDGSIVKGWSAGASTGLTPHLDVGASYESKIYFNPLTDEEPVSELARFTASHQLTQRLKFNADFGVISVKFSEKSAPAMRSEWSGSFDFWVSKVQKVSMGLKSEIQDFNAALVEQNLKTTHLFARNIMYWKEGGWGWYSELINSHFSDGNYRNMLFTSFYKSFVGQVNFKAGTNVLLMSFSNQKPVNYYSPKLYSNFEIFGGLEMTGAEWPLDVSMDVAGGVQLVDGDHQENARVQLSLSKSLGRLQIELSALHTTIAATAIAGFSYSEVRGKLSWTILKKPFFTVQ